MHKNALRRQGVETRKQWEADVLQLRAVEQQHAEAVQALENESSQCKRLKADLDECLVEAHNIESVEAECSAATLRIEASAEDRIKCLMWERDAAREVQYQAEQVAEEASLECASAARQRSHLASEL